MITAVTVLLISAMICTTLLVVNRQGVNINVNKNYTQVFRDETSYQKTGESLQSPEDLLKDKEPQEMKDFIEGTIDVLNSYYDEEGENNGQESEASRTRT